MIIAPRIRAVWKFENFTQIFMKHSTKHQYADLWVDDYNNTSSIFEYDFFFFFFSNYVWNSDPLIQYVFKSNGQFESIKWGLMLYFSLRAEKRDFRQFSVIVRQRHQLVNLHVISMICKTSKLHNFLILSTSTNPPPPLASLCILATPQVPSWIPHPHCNDVWCQMLPGWWMCYRCLVSSIVCSAHLRFILLYIHVHCVGLHVCHIQPLLVQHLA